MKTRKSIFWLFLSLLWAAQLSAQTGEPVEKGAKEKIGLGSPCSVGGVPLAPAECDELVKKIMERNRKRFIPPGFSRAYKEKDIRLLENAEPLIEKLEGILPGNSKIIGYGDATTKPRKGFDRNIEVTSKEDQKSKVASYISLRIKVYDSLKQAEAGLVETGSLIPAYLSPGSLTGRELGELAYHNSSEVYKSASILFLRRNVMGYIVCHEPHELAKDTRKPSDPLFLDDPELKNKCEALVKKIDDEIIDLTNK